MQWKPFRSFVHDWYCMHLTVWHCSTVVTYTWLVQNLFRLQYRKVKVEETYYELMNYCCNGYSGSPPNCEGKIFDACQWALIAQVIFFWKSYKIVVLIALVNG